MPRLSTLKRRSFARNEECSASASNPGGFCHFLSERRSGAQAVGNAGLPPVPHAKETHLKHVLVIGETKGFQHDSISSAMAAIFNMAKRAGCGTPKCERTQSFSPRRNSREQCEESELLRCSCFASTTGELAMDDSQKADMLSFIKDDARDSSAFTQRSIRTTPGPNTAR